MATPARELGLESTRVQDETSCSSRGRTARCPGGHDALRVADLADAITAKGTSFPLIRYSSMTLQASSASVNALEGEPRQPGRRPYSERASATAKAPRRTLQMPA